MYLAFCHKLLGMDTPKLLLVDDERAITDNLASFLERAGFDVAVAADGDAALQQVARLHPDLIILDVIMPRLNGRAVLRRLRGEGNWTPIILLTHIGEVSERVMALEEGADDYINKPFDPHELVARIRAVLRRARSGKSSLASARWLTCGDLRLDRQTYRTWLGKRELTLTPKAFALLAYVLTHSDEVLSRERLLDAVWGWDHPVGPRTVDARIAELRRALGDDPAAPHYIATVPGVGYRFVGTVEAM